MYILMARWSTHCLLLLQSLRLNLQLLLLDPGERSKKLHLLEGDDEDASFALKPVIDVFWALVLPNLQLKQCTAVVSDTCTFAAAQLKKVSMRLTRHVSRFKQALGCSMPAILGLCSN